MRAELDVFSGVRNPGWELSAEEASELARRMTPLSRVNQPSAEGGLGYRGFIISNPEQAAGLPGQIRVFNGVITIQENGGTAYYEDTNGIDDWLLEQARRHGYGDIVS